MVRLRMNRVPDHCAQTRKCAAVVLDRPLWFKSKRCCTRWILELESWPHGRCCLSLKLKKNTTCIIKSTSIVHGCALHRCRDALNWSGHKQVAQVASSSSSSALAICCIYCIGLCTTYGGVPRHRNNITNVNADQRWRGEMKAVVPENNRTCCENTLTKRTNHR